MNTEQVNALNRVLAHYGHDDVKHYRESGEPSGHIAQSLLVPNHYTQHYQPAPNPNGDSAPDHPLGQAGPIGIVRDHDLTASEIATSLRISLFGEVSQFSGLPRAILEFAATAQQIGNVMLLEAALAAMRSYKHKLDDDIPF